MLEKIKKPILIITMILCGLASLLAALCIGFFGYILVDLSRVFVW